MTSKKTKSIVHIVCGLLIFLFVYTAVSKLLDFTVFKNQLRHSPLLQYTWPLVAPGLPIIELVTSLLLLLPGTQGTGLRLSIILLTLFTAYIGYMILFVPNLPCSCGGIISSLTWKQHLLVNIFFILMGLAGIQLKKLNSLSG